jgi:DNA-directed RNA polymerase specialized sigma24 family protein
MPPVPQQLSRTIETLYRSESGRVLATIVRLLGDLDLAEEAMHEAFAAALDEAHAWAKKAAIACDVPGEVRELLFYPTPEQGRDGSK